MLEAFGLSDPGRVRSNNEDYFITDRELGIFILADGMGGANAGEYASRLSAESLYQFLKHSSNGASTLQAGFREANVAVLEAAQASRHLEGMGTTLLAARLLPDDELEIGTVGDSRAYLAADGILSQVTEDQTWVAEVGVSLGLGEEALRRHPMRHVLTMAIGSTSELRVQNYILPLRPGNQVLLCSDGLHGVVAEHVVAETLDSDQNLPEKCHSLVRAARNAGGPDNITVILIQMT